jgi:3-oxoacyl-[acyl-carrier-protein] synthase-3
VGFSIVGTGSALPERAVTNDQLGEFLDTSDAWIRPRTGIAERRVCTTETLDDLALLASQRALASASVTPGQLDLIVCCTTSADHLMPAEACAIAELLGASCPAFDVSAACAGFVFALDVADGWFARGRAQHVLVVAAEKFSRLLDWSDRSTAVLFGDGAAAAVLAPGDGVLSLRLSTQPDVEALHVPGLSGNSPFDQTAKPPSQLKMDGRRVFKFGVTTICSSVDAMCADAQIKPSQIDHFVFHQANERILAAAVRRLGIDNGKVARTLEKTGNISSACIPLALDSLARNGELKPGDLVAMVGFGAGLDTGACLIKWG